MYVFIYANASDLKIKSASICLYFWKLTGHDFLIINHSV